MPRKPRQTPAPPGSDFSGLSDSELALAESLLKAMDIALKMRERARHGMIPAHAHHFEEMIETLQGHLDLVRRTSQGDDPH